MLFSREMSSKMFGDIRSFLLSGMLLFSLLFMLFQPQKALAASEPLNLQQIRLQFKSFQKPLLISGNFIQVKKLKELDVSIETTGQFQIKRESAEKASLLWLIEKPDQMRICVDEENIVLENQRLKKKTNLKLSEVSQQDSSGLTKLIHLIKLNPDVLNQDFIITQNKSLFIVKPKQAKSYQFTEAEIELDAVQNIKNILLIEPSGDRLFIQFLKSKEKTISLAEAQKKECR